MTKVLDPTNEATPTDIPRVARPESLEGLTVGLLDISKPRGDRFLDRIEAVSYTHLTLPTIYSV